MSDPNKGGVNLQRSSVAPAQAGMSRIEYVLILILLTSIAVGAWKTFGENAEQDEGVSLDRRAVT